MNIFNLGSLNFDQVYHVPHFVLAEETLSATGYDTFCGGKGLNQSIAIARAAAQVYHIGQVGGDGAPLRELLQGSGVNTDFLFCADGPSGHAIIQVTPEGQNAIIVCGGTNKQILPGHIDQALDACTPGDLLLLQNETSSVGYAIEAAKNRGLLVAFNPSPITDSLSSYPLDLVDYFILNEIEGMALTGHDTSEVQMLDSLLARYPNAKIMLTVGGQGSLYADRTERLACGVCQVAVEDTTAAGDTFCGYFLAGIAAGKSMKDILLSASVAAGIAVSRPGASDSIPTLDEVNAYMLQHPLPALRQI